MNLWYKVAQVLSSSTNSAFTSPLSAVPGGVGTAYIRPPFTLPQLQVVIQQVSSLSSEVTFSVTIIDPQGGGGTCTVIPSSVGLTSLIDLTTSSPATTYTATIGVARNFQANLSAPLAGAGSATFRAVETSRYDGYGSIFFGVEPQNAAPSMVIAIASNTSPSVATAKAALNATGPSNAASMKWLANTTGATGLDRASVIAGGASVSAGAPTFTVPDLGVNLNLNDSVYVGIVYYDVGGNPQTYAFGQATRSLLQATKTATYSAAGLIPVGKISGVTSDAAQLDSSTTPGVVALTNSTISAGIYRAFMNILLPPGTALATVSQDIYWGSQNTLLTFVQNFYRNPSGGGSPTLLINGTVTAGLGWQTAGPTTLVGETVQGNGYMYLVQWAGQIGKSINQAEGLVGNIYLTYTSPTSTASF